MKFIMSFIIVLAMLISCVPNTSKKNKPNNIIDSSEMTDSIVRDTINSSVPIGIGNDEGFLTIETLRTFIGQQLIASEFIVRLEGIDDHLLKCHIKKEDLMATIDSAAFKHTELDYLKDAVVETIEFDSVRSNTLYFNAVLKNTKHNKEIKGRFNLFYTTKKKGTVYGWLTDEIKEYNY